MTGASRACIQRGGLLAGLALGAEEPDPAGAAPGKGNGRIVFTVFEDFDAETCTRSCGASVLRSVGLRTGATSTLTRCDSCEDRLPAVSPGGRRIAFERTVLSDQSNAPDRQGVYVARIDGRRAKRVVANADSPAWSPNGKALALVARDGIAVVRPSGRRVRRLTLGLGSDLDWSRRGQIVFAHRRRGSDIYVVDADGGRPRRLTRDGRSRDPVWSPDGRAIAFTRSTRGTYGQGVFVMDASGGRVRQIARGATTPTWSPDGNAIAYSRGNRIVVARQDGSRRRVVTRLTKVNRSIVGMAWQPRRRR